MDLSGMDYRTAIVTFVDILGFSALVDRSSEARDVTAVNSVYDIVSQFRRSSDRSPETRILLGDEIPPLETHFVHFSDSVVRICYLRDHEHRRDRERWLHYALLTEIYLISGAQEALADRGVFIRGGLTIGDISYEPSTGVMFGPALNSAYRIESQEAVYPRIVIDPMIGGTRTGTISDELEVRLFEDLDGLRYIDYMGAGQLRLIETSGGFDDDGWTEGGIRNLIERIGGRRVVVEEKLRCYRSVQRIAAKYVWVAKKHNEYVDSLMRLVGESSYRSLLPALSRFGKVDDALVDGTAGE